MCRENGEEMYRNTGVDSSLRTSCLQILAVRLPEPAEREFRIRGCPGRARQREDRKHGRARRRLGDGDRSHAHLRPRFLPVSTFFFFKPSLPPSHASSVPRDPVDRVRQRLGGPLYLSEALATALLVRACAPPAGTLWWSGGAPLRHAGYGGEAWAGRACCSPLTPPRKVPL